MIRLELDLLNSTSKSFRELVLKHSKNASFTGFSYNDESLESLEKAYEKAVVELTAWSAKSDEEQKLDIKAMRAASVKDYEEKVNSIDSTLNKVEAWKVPEGLSNYRIALYTQLTDLRRRYADTLKQLQGKDGQRPLPLSVCVSLKTQGLAREVGESLRKYKAVKEHQERKP
jgi:hypothetical protein